MVTSEKQKMIAGGLYLPNDPEIQADSAATQVWLPITTPPPAAPARPRPGVLRERRAAGAKRNIRPPFYCDYGFNIRLGTGVFMNFNCVVLDVTHVTIGDRTQIGPAVQIYAADHPRDLARRREGFEFGRPVAIGADVWIGGGAIILPGVTIGDGAIIGAGIGGAHDEAGGPAGGRQSGAGGGREGLKAAASARRSTPVMVGCRG